MRIRVRKKAWSPGVTMLVAFTGFDTLRLDTLRHRPTVLFQSLDQLRRFFLTLTHGTGPYQVLVLRNRTLDAAAGANYGAVVSLAHPHPNFREAKLGRLANQVH